MHEECRKYLVIITIYLFPANFQVNAQTFSSLNPSFENPYRMNAAFPGCIRYSRLTANYITSGGATLKEADLSYLTLFDVLSGSLGSNAIYSHDQQSGTTQVTLNTFYSYKLIIYNRVRNYLCVSAGTGLGIRYFKGRNISQNLNLSLSPGIVAYTPKFYAGVGANNIQVVNKLPEAVIPDDQNKIFNSFAGAWLPMDNWKRDPEIFLSPDIEYCSDGGRRNIAAGAYFAWKWLMPGMFYEFHNYRPPDIRISLGFSKDAWRLYLLAVIPKNDNISYKNLTSEISLVKRFHLYRRERRWRSNDIHCPATW